MEARSKNGKIWTGKLAETMSRIGLATAVESEKPAAKKVKKPAAKKSKK